MIHANAGIVFRGAMIVAGIKPNAVDLRNSLYKKSPPLRGRGQWRGRK